MFGKPTLQLDSKLIYSAQLIDSANTNTSRQSKSIFEWKGSEWPSQKEMKWKEDTLEN